MRVNIIGPQGKTTGLSQDIQILHGMIAHVYGESVQVRYIPHHHPHCPQAELNFFMEVINPSLFVYAAKNIWIPNPEWTYRSWEPYAKMIDEIWVKTQNAVKLFREEWGVPVKYIGWTSIDKVMPSQKNFYKAIVPVGKNIWRHPKPILQAYMRIERSNPSFFKSLPELHIVHSPQHVPIPSIPPSIQSKVVLHSEVMSDKNYDELLHQSGLCICLSAAEGFGHAVNEAMSAGCVLLLSPIDSFLELTKEAIWVSNEKIINHPNCLGVLEEVEIESIVDALTLYCSSQFLWKKTKSQKVRNEYNTRHSEFVKKMTQVLAPLAETPEHSLEKLVPKEEELPSVSVITITRDRRAFIPLAKYSFLAQSYPEEKLEWVIVDDGIDQIKDLVSDLPNVKYVLVDTPMTIGEKRNLAVQKASHDVLVMMDDDDVYPNNSVLSRVAHMLTHPAKECLFSTTIPCFEIHDKKSFMNVPPMTLPMADRVSEATLCFTRRFWDERKFPDQQIAEGGAFIRGREHMCREFSPQDVIVSLVHKKNSSSRKPPQMEPNGCHYGFSDELYTLVSEIANTF
jgi:hypothetical protein